MMVILAGLFLALPPSLGPPVSPGDLARFGVNSSEAYENWRFAVEHCAWIAQVCDTPGYQGCRPDLLARYGDRWPVLWHMQAKHCCRAWCILDDALREECHDHDVGTINEHLVELRAVIGVEAYREGRMPPVVPYHFFRAGSP